MGYYSHLWMRISNWVLVVLAVAAVSIAAVLGANTLPLPQFALFIGMTWGVSLIAVITDLARRRPLDILSPFILVPATIGFVYTGTATFLSNRGDGHAAAVASTALLLGMAGYLLGVIGTRVLIGAPPAMTPVRSFTALRRQPKVIYTVFAIGALSMLIYWARTGGVPILQSDLENSRVEALSGNGVPFYLSMLMMVATWISLSPNSGVSIRMKWTLFAAAALLIGSTGWRNTIISFVLVALFIVHYSRPIRTLYIALAGLIALLGAVALGLLRIFSSSLENYQTFQLLTQGDLVAATASYLRSYTDTFGENLAVTMSVVERGFPSQNGETFVWNFLALLPGQEREPFDFVLKQAAGQTFAGGGLPPTLVGEWFLNFGWVGIALGMALFGAIVTVSHSAAIKTIRFPALVVSVIVANYSFIAVRGGMGNLVLTVVWLSLATLIVGRLSLGPASEAGERTSSRRTRPANGFAHASSNHS